MAYLVLTGAQKVASSLLLSEGRKKGGGSSPKIERRKLDAIFKEDEIYANEFVLSVPFLKENGIRELI